MNPYFFDTNGIRFFSLQLCSLPKVNEPKSINTLVKFAQNINVIKPYYLFKVYLIYLTIIK